MNTIAYLVYGDNANYQLELTLSVASVIKFLQQTPSDIRVVVVTDQHLMRNDLPIEYIRFSNEEFKEWTNDGAYLHLAKIYALIKVLTMSTGSVVLIDTDTYFLQHPSLLFDIIDNDSVVMHANEGAISDIDYWKPITDVLPRQFGEHFIDPNVEMFNSGVIGALPDSIPLLKQSITLANDLNNVSNIFSIEQFVVGFCLSKTKTICTADTIVKHYWSNHERLFVHSRLRSLLPSFTSSSFENLVSSNVTADLPTILLFDKIIARFIGWRYKWDGNTRFAFLCYRSALSAKDNIVRDAWFEVAKIFLEKNNIKDKDFKKLFARIPR